LCIVNLALERINYLQGATLTDVTVVFPLQWKKNSMTS